MTVYIVWRDPNWVTCAEDYLVSINRHLRATIVQNINIVDINNENNIVIFLKELQDGIEFKYNNIFVINLEQLTRKKLLDSICEYSKKATIIDYSMENIDILSKAGVKNTIYFPYLYNPSEIYNIEKIKEVCTVGCLNTERRINILRGPLFRDIKFDNICGWREKRDRIVFQYRILLNISAGDDYNVFEPMRCYRAMFNKMIVISEHKYNVELIEYSKHIIFAKIEEIPSLIKKVLDNYDYYYNMLELDNIDTKLNDNLVSVDKLKK